MATAADISPTIVEALYSDALSLADEARDAFDLSGRMEKIGCNEGLSRIALSCEALRTTTRMMHVIAWLLNHRAYFAGELSEFQLRRHGRLPGAQPAADPEQLAMLSAELRDVVNRTTAFYARVSRLDNAWRERFSMEPAAIHRLRDRLGIAVHSL